MGILVFLFPILLLPFLPLNDGMVVSPTPESRERKTILFTGWQGNQGRRGKDVYFPRTDNYYFRIKPESVVEILMDGLEEEETPLGPSVAEHTSITTSVNNNNAEFKTSCAKEPGCRWECEPRQDELPPDCDCVCFYTDAKWENIP